MAIDEAGLADLALDFGKLMEGAGPKLRTILDEMPLEKGRSSEFYEGALHVAVEVAKYLQEELNPENIEGKIMLTIVGAFSARCAELLIDARLRGA